MLVRAWFDSKGSLSALAELEGDRLHVQPTSELRAALLTVFVECSFEREHGAPKDASKAWRVFLGRWHWPTVRVLLPEMLVAHVESERPDWLEWIAKEEAIRARRPADPLLEVLRVQASLFAQQPPEDLNHPWYRLYPYQRVGVQWVQAALGRGIIGDEMGVGKSPQGLMVLERNEDVRRALIICPGSLPVNWHREAAVWAPSWTLSVAWSTKDILALQKTPPADRSITIVSWGLVSRPTAIEALLKIGFDAVIADECHYAKNGDSMRTVGVIDLMHGADVRLPLTGTPVKSRPAEFWTLLHMIDPIRFHSFFPWGETFCGARNQNIGARTVRTYKGSARLPKMVEVTKPYVLRRERLEVLTDLPPKSRQILPIKGPSALVAESTDLLKELRDPSRLGGSALGRIGGLRKKIGLAKVEAATEWAVSAYASGEPTVLFVYHHDVALSLQSALEKEGLRVGRILGDTPVKDRMAIVDAFQRGDLDTLIGSEAVKEGISLVRAALSLQVEWWYTPADMNQAEDRLCRNRQLRAVLNVYLLLEGTLDGYLAALIAGKREVVDASLSRDTAYKMLLRYLEGVES